MNPWDSDPIALGGPATVDELPSGPWDSDPIVSDSSAGPWDADTIIDGDAELYDRQNIPDVENMTPGQQRQFIIDMNAQANAADARRQYDEIKGALDFQEEQTIAGTDYADLSPAGRRKQNELRIAAQQGADPLRAGYEKVFRDAAGKEYDGEALLGGLEERGTARGSFQALAGLGQTLTGFWQRITGDTAGADQTERAGQAMRGALDDLAGNDPTERMLRDVGETTFKGLYGGRGGGLPTQIAQATNDSYNSARVQALDAGMDEATAIKYAAAQATIEGGVTAIFSKLGIGGTEKLLSGSAKWHGAKALMRQLAGEWTEEQIIAHSQDVLGKLADVDPREWTLEGAAKLTSDVTVQVGLAMGAAQGLSTATTFLDKPSYETAKAAGIEKTVPTQKARVELAAKVKQSPTFQEAVNQQRERLQAARAQREERIQGLAESMVATKETPSPAPGTIRFYHGGNEYTGGSRWLTQDLGYAEGYAKKVAGNGFVQYVDIPENSPILAEVGKTFDDTDTDQTAPYAHFDAPSDIASQLRPLIDQATQQPPIVPSESAAGILPKAALQLDAVSGRASRLASEGKRWFKQNFLSGGEQNEATSKLLYQRDGIIRGHLAELSQNSRDLKAAVHKAFSIPRHKQIPETVSQAMDAALKDQTKMAALPTDVAVELQKMRDHVDGLSRTVQGIPGISDELQLSIDENMGQYITRTYKKFGDTDGWARKALADKQIMADFAAEVRQKSPEATDADVAQLAEILLRRNTTNLADLGRFAPRTNKFVNVLKQRKDLSDAVRKLYGERTDAFENYTDTVSRLSNLVAHRLFVSELKKAGIEQGFFSDASDPKPGHVQEVNGQIPQLRGLEGVLMTPEVADSINDIYTSHTPSKVSRFLTGVMGLSKASKTVGSVQATVRNFTGNIPIAIANGAWDPRQLAGAAKATWWSDLWNKGDAATKAEIRNLHELGLIEGVTVEALRDIASRTSATVEDYIAGVDSRNHFKNATRGVAKIYQSMDTVWKVHTFYSYLPQYRDAHPDMSEMELRQHVARIVRDITPTYSEASKAAKFWSRYMPVGPFAMFNAEMWRTTGNRIRLSIEEMKSGNPALQKLAAKRFAGQAAALTLPAAVALVARQMIGISDEEEEALRQRVAPWQRNAVLIPRSKDISTGTIEYFDASYNDPFSVFSNPMIALSRGEAGEAAGELAEPFIAEDLAAGMVVSIMRNSDEHGRQVYDPGLLPSEQNMQIAQFVAERFEPGTVTSGRRIARAAKGQTSSSGKEYDLSNELASLAAGVRLDTMDRAQSDLYRNLEFEGRIQDSQKTIRRIFLKRGSFDAAEAAELYQSAEASRKQSLAEWRKYVDGSVLLGEKNPYGKVASDVGGESAIMKMMYARQYRPYQFRPVDLAKMRSLPGGAERVELYLKLRDEQAN